MYTFCIVMIAIASILLILAVLVQSPKSGMAANFGAANQTIGVRQTTDILEKFTWAMIVAIVVFSLLSTTAVSKKEVKEESLASKVLNETNTQTENSINVLDSSIAPLDETVIDEAAAGEQIVAEEE
ncbi:MAG: preprotein translocase subunit SecG [Alistipes sp.]|nr:preprotein translocase subunit SecG [Alistipes sp.]